MTIEQRKSEAEATPADSLPGHWSTRFAPEWALPYLQLARLERPIGTWLLLWPCWWSVALATPAGRFPDLKLMVLFGLGALLMRGAGCTYNDIVDRDIDARVARTRGRPLPSGRVSVAQASIFIVMLLAVAFVILLQFNRFTVLLGMASLAVVLVYPFAKRFTDWPQIILGLAFNWGALMGWAAVRGEIALPAALLYAAGIAWTLGYDTIYALQDIEDDALIGVRSTARLFGANTRKLIAVSYAVTAFLFALAALLAGFGPIFGGVALFGILHLARQAWTLDTENPTSCLRAFRSNVYFGWIMFAALTADRLLPLASG